MTSSDELSLLGCTQCDGMNPRTVSELLCDSCLRGALRDSTVGRERWALHPSPGYLVSNLGHVRAPGRTLTPFPGGKGMYPTVMVAGKQRRVHHLVLEAFIGPKPPGTEACHWDGDTNNNTLFNLRWDDRAGNERDRARRLRERDDPWRLYRRDVVRRVLADR